MRRMNRVAVVLAVMAGWLACAGPACAQDPIHKVGRGLTNVVTCFLEIPKGIFQGTQEENPVVGAATGLVKGAWLGVTRLVVGAYETLTFPLPYPKGYASPYEGLELTDYVWE